LNHLNSNKDSFFFPVFEVDPPKALSGPTESLAEILRLRRELDTGWPWPLSAVQPFFENMYNRIVNIPARVWDFFQDKLRDALEWMWRSIAWPIVMYAWDVYRIVVEWTADWGEPWRSIGRLFLFPVAFAYKGLRDYVGPALSNAVNEVKKYFDGAFQAAADTIKSVFSPVIDPLKDFLDKAKKFFTEDVPSFFKQAADFFASLPGKIADFYSWVKDVFEKGFTSLVDFFTKTLPDWFEKVKNFFSELPDKARKFFLEDLPNAVKDYLSKVLEFLNEHIAKPAQEGIRVLWDSIKGAVENFARAAWEAIQNIPRWISEHGVVGTLLLLLPITALEFGIAVMLDIASLKIAGSGLDPDMIRKVISKHLDAMFDLSMFTSVMFAVAVQKPLEREVKRIFRTERPSPGDALNFLSKNLITEEEAMYYLQIAGYPDEIAKTYIRSIYREPPFEAVFTAYRRGKIDEREYRAWLSILNIDRAETLAGTLYPYKVLEEATYRVPSSFILVSAVEAGELSEDTIRRMLEYELIHPEFIEPVAKGLLWRAARDDRALLRKYVTDAFIDGAMKLPEYEHYLSVLGLTGDLTKSIIEVADLSRRKSIRRKALSYLEKQFLEGYMRRDEFVNQLVSYGFDEDLVREYAALLQYVRDNYVVVKETKDERSALKASLVNKYKRGLLTDEELEQELRKLNLNEIEIALTIARAKLEFDAEQKEILFNDLIEKIKQGWLNKSEFIDQCTRLGIKYERCVAYADYYWTKYIGDQFYVITKDERLALASILIKKYVMGFMTEDQLRQELKKLMFTDEEIELRIRRAIEEDEIKMLSDLLAEADNLLKKGEMTPEEYIEHLTSLGMRRERAEARANKILAGVKRR